MIYGREYEEAGFPSPSQRMGLRSFGLLIFIWVIGTALVTVAFTS